MDFHQDYPVIYPDERDEYDDIINEFISAHQIGLDEFKAYFSARALTLITDDRYNDMSGHFSY